MSKKKVKVHANPADPQTWEDFMGQVKALAEELFLKWAAACDQAGDPDQAQDHRLRARLVPQANNLARLHLLIFSSPGAAGLKE